MLACLGLTPPRTRCAPGSRPRALRSGCRSRSATRRCWRRSRGCWGRHPAGAGGRPAGQHRGYSTPHGREPARVEAVVAAAGRGRPRRGRGRRRRSRAAWSAVTPDHCSRRPAALPTCPSSADARPSLDSFLRASVTRRSIGVRAACHSDRPISRRPYIAASSSSSPRDCSISACHRSESGSAAPTRSWRQRARASRAGTGRPRPRTPPTGRPAR